MENLNEWLRSNWNKLEFVLPFIILKYDLRRHPRQFIHFIYILLRHVFVFENRFINRNQQHLLL